MFVATKNKQHLSLRRFLFCGRTNDSPPQRYSITVSESLDDEAHALYFLRCRRALRAACLRYRQPQHKPSAAESLCRHWNRIGSSGLTGAYAEGRDGAERLSTLRRELDLVVADRAGRHEQPCCLTLPQCMRKSECHLASVTGLPGLRRWSRC